ncbi:hypothetical protein [Zobellia sp. B3R18]|uniref:hypothetical protein n=1 Tax=Zobellia sp. B3R18 TaxID=2841568 RepID=UPI001C075702|nr:hypothetical protein [Zobellia sp. B3R18]MBU2973003.1 hypothetical protein [Zobellia sp. B3R18]
MRKFVVMALLVVSANSFAQKMKVSKGDIKNLKDISVYTLEFDYSNLEIPKYDSEDDFLEDKMAKREEKEAGKGEEFKKSWFADRQDRYEPKFIESFNKRFDDGEVSVSMEDADYTMKIHTNKIYAGYNVGVVRKNAEIDATITVYETANPSNVLLEGKYSDVQGYGAMGNDYNSGYRISECYAKLAKNMAGFIIKKALK